MLQCGTVSKICSKFKSIFWTDGYFSALFFQKVEFDSMFVKKIDVPMFYENKSYPIYTDD